MKASNVRRRIIPKIEHGLELEAGPAEQDGSAMGLERILFFSDAVMAIAITLLAIDLKLPEMPLATAGAELPRQLAALGPKIMSFVISFALVGVYWSSHHRYFGYIRRYDARLILLNLVFLLFVALMPFSASVLGQYGTLPLALSVYAAVVAATGFAIGGIWWYASRAKRLIDPALDAGFIAIRSKVALVVPFVFLISIPVAWLNPIAATVIWWTGPFASIAVLRSLEKRNRHG